MCNFVSSVSSQQKFEAMDVKALSVTQLSDRSVLQIRVTAQFYLNKGKYILETWGHADPKEARRLERAGGGKREREKKRERESAHAHEHVWESPGLLASSFYMFFPPPGPALCKLGHQECCWSYLRSSLSPRIFLCSSFVGFSLPCLLATTILDSFFLF